MAKRRKKQAMRTSSARSRAAKKGWETRRYKDTTLKLISLDLKLALVPESLRATVKDAAKVNRRRARIFALGKMVQKKQKAVNDAALKHANAKQTRWRKYWRAKMLKLAGERRRYDTLADKYLRALLTFLERLKTKYEPPDIDAREAAIREQLVRFKGGKQGPLKEFIDHEWYDLIDQGLEEQIDENDIWDWYDQT